MAHFMQAAINAYCDRLEGETNADSDKYWSTRK